ncbi:hypothetical protein L915_05630 [Phytophthora nicotianae]|uniref:Uncharacterized protein n=1 Tax=Phytophthora nicotianae TaxID=4792 RepID=W2H846_PHYNI|nr:hypothetical protein L915_05630 [Phytophthora nicotianae]
MLKVERKVQEMMSRRIDNLVIYVKKDIDKVLTTLVHLVSAPPPGHMEWKQVEESPGDERFGCCFESSDSRYAVNLFMGVVLTDGNPPGGIPTNIREHKRFQRLFGCCNFEVNSVDGLFRTEKLKDKSDTTRPEVRMLLPVGSVNEGSDGMVDIVMPCEPDSRVEVVWYDMHRRLRNRDNRCEIAAGSCLYPSREEHTE